MQWLKLKTIKFIFNLRTQNIYSPNNTRAMAKIKNNKIYFHFTDTKHIFS